MNIVSRPWEPKDLLDDLQMYIDEEPDNYLNGRRTTMCMARDFLKEHFREDTKMIGWISVEDEKPKKRGHYFIAYKFAGSDMRFYGEAMWHDDMPGNGYVQGSHFSNEGVEGMYVTHWMKIPKLPEPPKED